MRSPSVQSAQWHHDRLYTVVSASNLNQVAVPAMDMLSLRVHLQKRGAFPWWYLGAAGGRKTASSRALEEKAGIKRKSPMSTRSSRTNHIHAEGGQVAGGHERCRKIRVLQRGLAGDGQDDGSAGRHRRAGRLGRAFIPRARRRGGGRRCATIIHRSWLPSSSTVSKYYTPATSSMHSRSVGGVDEILDSLNAQQKAAV